MVPRRKLNIIPARSLAPNVLTVLALCAGMTSIKFALDEKWELAVGAVLVAGLFDMLDGRIARLVKGTSRFGAELDSLSDVISFGLAPAILMFLWTLNVLGGAGWLIALAFAVCCALRLARFNVMHAEGVPQSIDYFTGVPAPAGAVLALWPMVLSFQFESAFFREPLVAGVVVGAAAFLMVSQLPTFSFKRLRVRGEHVLPTLIVVGLLAASLSVYTWGTISILSLLYILSIPLSFRRVRARDEMPAKDGDGQRVEPGFQAGTSDRSGKPPAVH
ncbi:MAG: CDP-diacylglycerol--serine O-phosphatidyltransferase [Alphaproteobacteria bacterium]|nr:MAG: CDP-diacylglycerol--serine O-phosphatidyltransferase [Alphaproteobacteria bacterium]